MYYRPVYAAEIINNANQAAKVMHPDLIWPGLCSQLKRKPSRQEWLTVLEGSPFLKDKTDE